MDRKAYRFRILNASNDRTLNLQLYYAKSNATMWNPDGTLNTADAGEVPMVAAVKTAGFPANWPTDGRDGGVPDPTAAGPQMIQIGTEGGLLPAPVPLTNQPVNYDYNRRDITVLNVSTHTLLLGPAERADVIVDFSQVPAGSKLILYNDAPAPVPGVRPALRLLHRRPGPDRHRRRADDPARLRPQHPDHHAVPGAGRDGRCRVRPGRAADRAAGRVHGVPAEAHRPGGGLRRRLRHHDTGGHLLPDPGHESHMRRG